MNPIFPTIGRKVLVRGMSTGGTPVDIPADITDVHGEETISVVAQAAFPVTVQGVTVHGAVPLTSLPFNDSQEGQVPRVDTWRWMPVQAAGGGFDKRITDLEAQVEAINKAQPKSQRVDLDQVVEDLRSKVEALDDRIEQVAAAPAIQSDVPAKVVAEPKARTFGPPKV